MFGLFAFFSAGGETLWERIVTWYQNSLIHELFSYVGTRYFTVEFGTYENFSVGANASTTARNMIIGFAVGIILAAVMTAHARNGLGGFVRKLLRTESLSPEQAKTLHELGYFRNPTIRRELARGTTLRMVVRHCENDSNDGEETNEGTEKENDEMPTQVKKTLTGIKKAPAINFLTARFYIPEELRYRADIRFDKTGSSWGMVTLTVIVTVVGAAALCWFLPDLFQFADNIITFFSPN